MRFSKRLIQLRKERDLTQSELSDLLGISRSSESMYESGNRMPTFELADRMAEFFDVDLSYLLGSSDIRRPYGGDVDEDVLALDQMLPPDQYALLLAYRNAIPEVRSAALRMLGVR